MIKAMVRDLTARCWNIRKTSGKWFTNPVASKIVQFLPGPESYKWKADSICSDSISKKPNLSPSKRHIKN